MKNAQISLVLLAPWEYTIAEYPNIKPGQDFDGYR